MTPNVVYSQYLMMQGEKRGPDTGVNPIAVSVIAGPVVAWLVALLILHGSGGVGVYAFLFLGLPFLLVSAIGLATGRPGRGAAAGVLAAGLAALSWLVVAVTLAPLAS